MSAIWRVVAYQGLSFKRGFTVIPYSYPNDNNKNWRKRLLAISSMFVVQFLPNFMMTYIMTLAICGVTVVSKVDYH